MRFLLLSFILLLFACKKEDAIIKPKTYDFTKLEEKITSSMSVFNGGVVVLIAKDGELIFQKSYGNLNLTSLTPVASASKMVSAAVMLSLVDEGKLDLNKKVADYLPEFQKTGLQNIKVTHTFNINTGLEECGGTDPNCLINQANVSLKENVTNIANTVRVIFEPGTTLNYGGLSFQVGGKVAEVVSGKDWNALFKEKIGIPCEMNASFYSTLQKPNVGGGLVSTPIEYFNFLTMLANGGKYKDKQILSRASVDIYFKTHTDNLPIVSSPFPANPPFHPYNAVNIYYGFGSWIDVKNPQTNEVEQISSPGYFGTYPWIDKKRNIAGLIFTKSEYTKTLYTELELIDIVRKAIDEAQ